MPPTISVSVDKLCSLSGPPVHNHRMELTLAPKPGGGFKGEMTSCVVAGKGSVPEAIPS